MPLLKPLLLITVLTAAIFVGRVDAQARPNAINTCFVRNCPAGNCSIRNPYVCLRCATGYALTSASGCNSCAPGYEQNLDAQSFLCSKCPEGTTSPGGTGLASECKQISVTTGRRLFEDTYDEMWA